MQKKLPCYLNEHDCRQYHNDDATCKSIEAYELCLKNIKSIVRAMQSEIESPAD